MDIPETTHPHLVSIGESLGRSIRRNLVDNDLVRSAFAELEFELALAGQMGTSAPLTELLEPSA